MISDMIKRTGRKFIKFCVKNSCFILPYPDSGTRARFLKNSALFVYVLVLLSFQLFVYRASPQILGFATNIKVDEVYTLVNQERSEAGLSGLSRSSKLEKAALEKARDMFAKNYWAHYAPDGSTTPWQFIISAGYSYKYAGENLAKDFDTSAGVVAGWIGSASHKANMLNANYKDVGIATVNGTLLGEETTLVVQMLGTPLATTTASSSGSSTASKPSSSTAGAESQSGPKTEAEPEPEPKIVVGPTEEAASQPTELAHATLSPVEQVVKVFDPVASPKTIPLGFGLFLMGLFALDEVSMLKGGLTKSELRRTAENVAHMVILGLLMVVVWVTKAGGVL